jgi:transposase
MANLKRTKFAATSERFANTLSPEQRSLLEVTLDTDIHELDGELQRHRKKSDKKDEDEKQQPKRAQLPTHLPRRDVPHEPTDTSCGCGQAMQRIGEDVSEKLDYQPGVFTVERHVRGKWVCKCCERIVQAPVPAHVIDKGIPTTGLLAHVLVAKYLDHLLLYRQEAIFERAGHAISRSTLAQRVGECGVQLQPLVDALTGELLRQPVLHADETSVAMLKPAGQRDGKTHRAYLWSYCSTQFSPLQAVVFEFADSRGGQHARDFLGLPGTPSKPAWQGKLVCDDFAGYKACFELGVTEVGCMAHARRKFHEL